MTEPENQTSTAPPSPRTPQQRLRRLLAPRLSRGQLVGAVLLAALGFALAVQLRASGDAQLTGLRQQDLVRILDEVSQRNDQLQQEVGQLQRTRAELQANGNGAAAVADAQSRAESLAILTGQVPVTGPGLVMTINDPTGQVDSATILDTVEELRGAGAEAIQVGDVRVVASTAFTDGKGGILVDGQLVSEPYRVLAIGPSDDLQSALQLPGGVVETIRQAGASAVLQTRPSVKISALHELPARQYARPAPEPTSSGG